MGLNDKIIGAIMVSVFVLALLTFGYQAQIENGVNVTILDDKHFAGLNDSFERNLSTIRGESKEQKDNFFETTPQTGEVDINILTVPGILKRYVSMMFNSFNLVGQLLSSVFGVPALIFNLLGGLLLITIVILSWRVIKGGGT